MTEEKAGTSAKSFGQKINIFKVNSISPSLLIVLIVMFVIFGSINRDFFSFQNFKGIIASLSVTGVMSVGLAFVVLTGNFDVSIGSILGFSAVVMGKLFNVNGGNIPIPVIIIVGLLVGAAVGALNGFLVTFVGINSVITTLGTLAVFRGLSFLYANDPSLIDNKTYVALGRGFIAKAIPYTFIYLLVVFVVAYLVLRFTKFGRDIYQVGSNPSAARLAGLSTKKMQFWSFVIAGVTSAMAAVIMTSQAAFAQGEFGLGFEFTILTIVVLGGISLTGGRGTLVGVAVALLIINSISNGLTMMSVPVNWREAFNGIILIAAILIDSIRVRRRELLKA
ncbi:MAG: ABC transporter permease [Actinobacteria bacterium]|nr:ABC transporter permease [Actinomycetota bacterium]